MSRVPRWLAPLVLACFGLAGCYMPTIARTRGYHPSDADITVTRIVHGSVILDFGKTRILLDPWYSASPPLGPAATIGLGVDNLPPLRGLLLTQRRDDHFDTSILRNLPDKSLRVIARRGLGEELRAMGYQDVVELEDWERSQIGSVIVTAVPARQAVAENGYILQGNLLTVYVAGDTLFDEALFRQISERYPQIDVALLPIGGIRVFGTKLDMTPEEAAQAFAILKPQHVVPYHYELTGPFPIVTTATNPTKNFVKLANATTPGTVVVLDPGESWHHYR